MARSRTRVRRLRKRVPKDIDPVFERIDEIASAIKEIEAKTPQWDDEPIEVSDRIIAADSLAQLEQSIPILREFGEVLADGSTMNQVTVSAAAARRSVAMQHRIIDHIEGMDFVKATGILRDLVGNNNGDDHSDIDNVEEFLEYVIDCVVDDLFDSRDWAIHRETAIIGVQEDPTVVNADGFIELSNQEGTAGVSISIRTIEHVSAESWCREFAQDAAAVIVSEVSGLDDSIEAREQLGNADRSLFTNEILYRATVDVILSRSGSSVYAEYEADAMNIAKLLDSAEDVPLALPAEEVALMLRELEESSVELLRVARDVAAHRTALAALEEALISLLD